MKIVSACLAGVECRFDCKAKARVAIQEMVSRGEAIPVCPEQMGGLSTPRAPAEQIHDQVITNTGVDVTAQYQKGAQDALDIAIKNGVTEAFLKSKSPMCGYEKIYDGTFSGTLKNGHGIFTDLLLKSGIRVESID